MENFLFIAVCVALSVSGLALTIYGARRFLRDRRLATSAAVWVSAEGEIISASLDIKETMGADQDRMTTYRPVVRYRYAAAGGEHTGSRVWLIREEFADEGAARKWLTTHPPGTRINVHHDPTQPDMAALQVDKPSLLAWVLTAGAGVFLLWTGLSLLLAD